MSLHPEPSVSKFTLTSMGPVGRRVGLLGVLLLLALASPAHAEFGIAGLDGQFSADPAGDPYTQAGGHPYAVNVTLDLATHTKTNLLFGIPYDTPWPDEPVKDVISEIPPGLVGNLTVGARCTMRDLNENPPLCSAESQVGVVTLRMPDAPFRDGVTPEGVHPMVKPVYNMVPPPGVPGRFGFNVANIAVTLDASLRSDGDYGVTINSRNISEGVAVLGFDFSIWGTPGDPAHDAERYCAGVETPGCPSTAKVLPFLTLPTSCTPAGVGLETRARVDSWFNPGVFRSASFFNHIPPNYPDPGWPGTQQALTGCDQVPFAASFAATPFDTSSPGATGYSFDLSVPQEDDPFTHIAPSALKKLTVTLPEGVRISPSAATGLEGCSSGQIGLDNTEDPSCPDGSKVGSLTVDTPLLDEPLQGSVYLAEPYDNPSNSLLALYLVAKGSGVIVKLPGSIEANGATGRLTATFDNEPQVPFSNAHIDFNGGSRAPLSNPRTCGTYTTHASLVSWSGKTVSSDSSFTTSNDGKGAACPPKAFAPGFIAGSVNPVAGASSPFTLRLTRTDGDSEFQSLSSLTLPRGLLADVGSVSTRCTLAQADAASCPAASRLGDAVAGAGAGPDPFFVHGDLYLTAPYEGNPFGLAAIFHAVAGPFDLGYVVVKGGIQIHDDGSVTVATDPFPTILQGIPLQIRDVRINMDRSHFMRNPTNCSPMSVNGSVSSTDGLSARVSSRFQVGECAALGFHPTFKVSTGAKTSRKNGASLHVVVTSGSGQANIHSVHVTLPKALPSRLTTLQKACADAVFKANPAACPTASRVGSAVAHSPLLANPLSGPVYFVSHGGAAFPDLVTVLQGEGITIHLVGNTAIKKNVTSSTFASVPDVPVTRFELTLPQGEYSALAATANVCKSKLVMPTRIVGQNGAVIEQSTKIAVAGCPKVKKHKRK